MTPQPTSRRSAQAGLLAAILLFVACLIVLILGSRDVKAAPPDTRSISAPALLASPPARRNPL